VLFSFKDFALDAERRELRARGTIVAIEPQVFDLLVYLIQNRNRVVSKDDLIASVWGGRIVSDSTLDSRINAVRKAIGDSGNQQELVRTIPRKGVRFVGDVQQDQAQPSRTIACRRSHTNKRFHFAALPTTSTSHTPPSGTALCSSRPPIGSRTSNTIGKVRCEHRCSSALPRDIV
jgi:DNA-binding winged helix-turn-helix (wHTH) protein